MDRLLALAEQHRLQIVEDAAHALGSTYKGRRIGSFGHATCFSFDPIKNITCGEGGAVALADDQVAETLRRKRSLGITKESWHRYRDVRNWHYEVTTHGYRYHMPNFCAAVGLVQLRKLDQFVVRRRAICMRYDAAFRDLSKLRILSVDYADTAPHIYVMRVFGNKRESFMQSLKDAGVDTAIHYTANHLQPFFRDYVVDQLPVATRLSNEVITLPLHCGMTDEDVASVIEAVGRFDGAA
jgi:perosamine synthetase